MCRRGIVVLASIALMSGCGRKETETPAAPPSLSRMESSDSVVYPLAGGGAYLFGQDESRVALYYLKGKKAARVRGIQGQALEFTLWPLADGTAYLPVEAPNSDRLVIYHLSGPLAVPITEVDSITEAVSSIEPLPGGFLWAALQSEITSARKFRSEQVEVQEPE